MVVHQCARFCASPKALHALVVKRIIRYLQATQQQGIIMKPSTNLTLDMYVDSNFSGMWHKEHSHLRNNVMSVPAMSSSLLDAQSHGWANCRQRSPCQPQRASTFLWVLPRKICFLYENYFKTLTLTASFLCPNSLNLTLSLHLHWPPPSSMKTTQPVSC